MNLRDIEGLSELFARLEDMASKADRGELAISPFLTPREIHYAHKQLSKMGRRYEFFGGYEDAERKRLYLLPDYMEDAELLQAIEDFGFSSEITAIEIVGSGYRELTHRDFLGSLLGLGLERAVIGDIVVFDDAKTKAVAFCDSRIAGFILQTLEKVANDKVKVKKLDISSLQLPARRFMPVSDTVASPRLDSIVASLCSLSRSKASEIVLGGVVELDFEVEDRPDRAVEDGAVISVRGYGKFRIHSVGELTRKGRYRLIADKYV